MYNLCMPLLSDAERRFLSAVSKLAYSNPFLPERLEHERAALGKHYVIGHAVWSASVNNPDAISPNVERVHAKLEPLVDRVRSRLEAGLEASSDDLAIYEDGAHYLMYQQYHPDFVAAGNNWRFYERFLAGWNRYFRIAGRRSETALQPAHLFACFRQVQRAFHHIFDKIIGNSMPAAQLRASVWQSVFTHDLRRYWRILYSRMHDFPTLITGPSGTGKELVARAIAGSRYVPFDPAKFRFADPSTESFIPINLAALSPTLIESELFGHRRGAFTGAIGDRQGWLDVCPAAGSVFLDELGELELAIQVKLLRVIETRRFSAVGATAIREFSGKLIAATNRDLPAEIRAGRFREDLYYRLCADLVRTPSLREQIGDSPAVLDDLLLFMVRRAVGDEAEQCLPEVKRWVEANLPRGYGWPGNYREVEQCVRNVIIRRSYQPIAERDSTHDDEFLSRLRNAELTADELLCHYAALVYRKTGTYEDAARRLGIDRRTVKAKVEAFLTKVTSRTHNLSG
jgi:transcriptional regulator with AAA-type ATPase domain